MGLDGGQHHALAALPWERPRIIVQEAEWASGPVWMGTESLAPPLRFDPQTVQPIVICYTDYAVLAAKIICIDLNVSDTYWHLCNIERLKLQNFETHFQSSAIILRSNFFCYK
jgi:hypothetical protein